MIPRRAACATCNHTFKDKNSSDLLRINRKSSALLRAPVGQLEKLNDRRSLFPFNRQLCAFSDARGKVLEQLDVGTIFMRRPAGNDNQLIPESAERIGGTCRLLTI